ncbi:hypothetical protein [Azospirillum sp. sgz301742]
MLNRSNALMQFPNTRPMARARRGVLALAVALLAAAGAVLPSDVQAQTTQSNIRQTKHNLSKNAPAANTVKSTDVDQVCVFCHTPHAATQDNTKSPVGPLWNRKLSTATYTTYASKSLDSLPSGAVGLDQPGGSSKLCLSCHDGTVAISKIGVLNGKTNPTVTMTGTAPDDGIPTGEGATTGFTRRLGIDLSNDHPISFTYDDALAAKDGELRKPTLSGGTPRLIDSRAIGYRPTLPLENGQMQCTTCHDPHLYDPADANRKFLRLNRLQKNNGPTTTFNAANDLICLACHTKDGYAQSAHADSTVANETYTNTAATDRGFPVGTQVWQASCLNCHDPHTVQGSRRLLREGTDGPDDGSGHHTGGSSATEEVCYACHSKAGNFAKTVLTSQGTANFEVPDVKTDFTQPSPGSHMPITIAGAEEHDIINKDGVEAQATLANRHVECPDCHNPHRVLKNKVFDGSGATTAGTHVHDDTGATAHSNTISGVLRGTWGVEPTYASVLTSAFGTNPTGFTVKRGDPGVSTATDVDQTYVTKEYQICLKCHSNYAYGISPPTLGTLSGTTSKYFTPSETTTWTGSLLYTNQAMEFQAPTNDTGEQTGTGGVNNNHRSWHPVMAPTGRDPGTRGNTGMNVNWLGPFSKAVGTQTMYCSDCHGSNVPTAGTVTPDGNSASNENGNPWGPHGSSNKFILKAPWSENTGNPSNSNDLCLHCHDSVAYATAGGKTTRKSGFWDAGGSNQNLHGHHVDRIANVNSGNTSKYKCSLCHIAVPHGWKNKAFLANLNDVGQEVGLTNGTVIALANGGRYYRAPYYMGSVLRVKTWAKAGQWTDANCGPLSGTAGKDWMKVACAGLP